MLHHPLSNITLSDGRIITRHFYLKLMILAMTLAHEFPMDMAFYNRAHRNPTDQRYYTLKPQTHTPPPPTPLVARAVSQLRFDPIQIQIDAANQVRQEIGTTSTLKSSVDLQKRLTVENTLFQLDMLRQLALLNQQQALEAQADVNEAI